MCVTTAAIGAGASILGTGMQALGQIGQGEAAGRAGAYRAAVAQNQAMLEEWNAKMAESEAGVSEYNAGVSENNAITAERYGDLAMKKGLVRAEARSQGTAARIGGIKAAQAGAGVDVNTGSAVDVRAGTRALGKLDAETDMAAAIMEKYGYGLRAQDFKQKAVLDRYGADVARSKAGMYRFRGEMARQGGAFAQQEGDYARSAGYLRALGTIAGGASQLPFGSWTGGGGGGTSGYSGTVQGSGGDYGANI